MQPPFAGGVSPPPPKCAARPLYTTKPTQYSTPLCSSNNRQVMYYKIYKGEGENDNYYVKHTDNYLKSFELLNRGRNPIFA